MTPSQRSIAPDLYIYAALLAVGVLSRLPFLGTFELVAYDGTYYLNQANALLAGTKMPGGFPIGYPAFVALFKILTGNLVTAGQSVSFLASIGSTIAIYGLAKHYVRWQYAALCGLLLTLNPLFIRLSLMTLSESLYIFWVLFGLLMMAKGRRLSFGLSMGVAAITRPEAIAILGVIALSRLRRPRELLLIVASFLVLYSVNSLVLSWSRGKTVILPKSEFLGAASENWRLREATVEFDGKEETFAELGNEAGRGKILVDYFRRIPSELRLLMRHVFPALFLLALFGMYRKRTVILLAALVPFFVLPLGTVRASDRYVLPYVPFIIIYAAIALQLLQPRLLRLTAIVLVFLSMLIMPVVNRQHLLTPEEPALIGMMQAALHHRDLLKPSDKIADRKPHFAFYAGGDYLEIPLAPYEDVMKYLVEQDVRVLALHRPTIHTLRPALRPLLYSRAVINGELRWRQTYFAASGEMIFMRDLESDPLTWTQLTHSQRTDVAPAWSPEGTTIAFRSNDERGTGGVYVVSALGGKVKRIVEDTKSIDALAWSPDGKRIAFAKTVRGNRDLFTIDVQSGQLTQLTFGPADDRSPSWCPGTSQIAYCSNRSGSDEIWLEELRGSEPVQLTSDGDNTNPAFSPSGDKIAFIKQGRGVFLLDRASQQIGKLPAPTKVAYTPAWSPDGRFLAVAAEDWGSWDIYLSRTDGTNTLLLTKNTKREGMPHWSPQGGKLVIFSERKGSVNLWTLGNLRPYLERLHETREVGTFRPPSP